MGHEAMRTVQTRSLPPTENTHSSDHLHSLQVLAESHLMGVLIGQRVMWQGLRLESAAGAGAVTMKQYRLSKHVTNVKTKLVSTDVSCMMQMPAYALISMADMLEQARSQLCVAQIKVNHDMLRRPQLAPDQEHIRVGHG